MASMKELPEAETYEEGLSYWPYKSSLQGVIDHILTHAPKNGTLLDLMCGPGYLLGKIAKKRPDMNLAGMDIDQRYIDYSKKMYSQATLEKGDILNWHPSVKYDVVACTGSIHHIPYDKQEEAVKNISSMIKPDGFVIISDCYIDDYSTELERKIAASKLGYEYLRETIQNKAPDRVIEWTADILWNDVFMKEFKTSLKKRLPLYNKYFTEVNTIKTWPDIESEYGDYISICKF